MKEPFYNFSKPRVEDWEKTILKDLKGVSIEEMVYVFDEGLSISPFISSSQAHSPLLKNENGWRIAEYINCDNVSEAHGQAMLALNLGVNALFFQIDRNLTSVEVRELLADIIPAFVDLHFVLGSTVNIAIQEESILDYLRSIVNYNYDLSVNFIHQGINNNGANSSINIGKPTPFHNQKLTSAVCLQLLVELDKKLQTLDNSTNYLKNIHCHVRLEDDYLVNISLLRALRLLIYNLVKAYDLSGIDINICAKVNPRSEDSNYDIIRAGSQAMSAAIGGADTIYIEHQGEQSNFSPHIAYNIHHIMQMESFMSEVQDPAAGSHTIESMTSMIANKVWEAFQQQD